MLLLAKNQKILTNDLLNSAMVHLIKPQLFRQRNIFGFNHVATGKLLLHHAVQAQKGKSFEPPIAVLVRTKNDAKGLKELCSYIDLARESYRGRIDLVVVDTESQDQTVNVARQFGAKLVSMAQQDFSYPKGINLGLQAVSDDVIATFITVGHAMPALSNTLNAGVRHFTDAKVVGVYSQVLPNDNASFGERLFFWNDKQLHETAHAITGCGAGVMGATNCIVRMSMWKEQPFDEAYAMGGEDTAWAKWAVNQGYKIVFEPALAVHHTHGLGPINLLRQRAHWIEVSRQAQVFDHRAIQQRRPDLFK